jgi:hypothetical protein
MPYAAKGGIDVAHVLGEAASESHGEAATEAPRPKARAPPCRKRDPSTRRGGEGLPRRLANVSQPLPFPKQLKRGSVPAHG